MRRGLWGIFFAVVVVVMIATRSMTSVDSWTVSGGQPIWVAHEGDEHQSPPTAPPPSTTASLLEVLKSPVHPAATCRPTTQRESTRPPTEMGPLDAEFAQQMKNERPPFGYQRPVRIALCLNGRSEVNNGDVVTPEQVMNITLIRWANLVAHVIEPAKALHPTGDVTFDTFVFTTSREFVPAIKQVLSPVRIESGDSLSWYHSPLHSLWLMWDHSQAHNLTYDRVLLLRNDVEFFFPIPWTMLNPRLFYVTNWCRAIGTPVPHAPNGSLCYPLSIFFHDSVHEGIPDFMFLGQSADMSLVFSTIIDDVLTCTTRPTSSCCAHAVYGGQIIRLYNERKLRVGRFMHHHLDFDLHRSMDPWRMRLHHRNLTWIPANPDGSYVEDVQEWVPRLWSWCTRTRAYCRAEGAPLTHGFQHW